MRKLKSIMFDENMEKDLNEIKSHFNQKFRITPSNTEIMNLLLKTYKESNLNISKNPKRTKRFEINF